jgi:hypothetical protein
VTVSVLVDARGARQVPALDMKCDAKEIPDFLDRSKPDGWWLIERCTFAGSVTPAGNGTSLGEPIDGTVAGTAAVAIGGGRLVGIISPQSAGGQPLWWAWPLSDVKVESGGAQGLFKKRPTSIQVHRAGGVDQDGDSLVFGGVARLYRSSGSLQTGQEASLLKALGG